MITQIKETKKEIVPAYRKRYSIFLDELQFRQYNLLIHGLRSLSTEERAKLSNFEERQIIYNNDKCWKVINILKQEKLNKLLTFSLNSVFGNSLVGNLTPFLLDPITDSNFNVDRDLTECNVSKEQIIHALIDNRLLPSNFLK